MTENHTAFGILFNYYKSTDLENGRERMIKLIGLCSLEFRMKLWPLVESCLGEGETLASIKAMDILNILDSDNYHAALATILQEAIRAQEGIRLSVIHDFNDSDNVILGYDLLNPPLDCLKVKDLVDEALRKYIAIVTDTVYLPCYHDYGVEVQLPREFFVDTPLGKIRVKAKYDKDVAEDYPGIYVDLITENGDETPIACVEYSPSDVTIAVDVYHDGENSNMVDRTYCRDLPGAELAEAKLVINDFVKEEYKCNGADFSDLNKVPVAWTEYEEEGYSVNVYADLVDFAIVTYVTPWDGEPVWVSSSTHDSLRSLIDDELKFLDFDYVNILESEWAVFAKDPGAQKWLAEKFPAGTRIRIPSYVGGGAKRGTITGMTEKGWLTVKMDDGTEETLGFGLSEFGIDGTEFKGKEDIT